MRTILFILVLLLSALVLLTNFENPWQEELRHQLHSLIGKDSLGSPQNLMTEDSQPDYHPYRSAPVRIEGGTTEYRLEPKSEDPPAIDVVQRKEAIPESFMPKAPQKTSPPAVQTGSEPIQIEKQEERLTAKEVKSLMEILDYARRRLLGLGEGASDLKRTKEEPRRSDGPDLNTKFQGKESIQRRLREVAKELRLDPGLALGMAEVESACNPKAVSHKGAVGVLQVMPGTAREHFGVSREMLFDPEVNIRVGLSWMRRLLERFDQNLDLSLAAYNAGSERVIEAGYKIPDIAETKEYVRKVRNYMDAGA